MKAAVSGKLYCSETEEQFVAVDCLISRITEHILFAVEPGVHDNIRISRQTGKDDCQLLRELSECSAL